MGSKLTGHISFMACFIFGNAKVNKKKNLC